jgi:hypothetical protein
MNEIITHTGKLIDIFNLKIEDINIHDISFGLSNIARFSGQVSFYSVARHSIHVASMLPDELKLSGLLHDASEAYIGDVISPIKYKMKEYLEIEKYLMDIISKKWNLDAKNKLILEADKTALDYEKSILFFKKEYRTENQKK